MAKTRRLSDASLVRRSQQGDRRAFGALVGRYDWRLRGLAHALLLAPGAMDEALSVAYLRAWRDVVRVSARDDIGAWLYRVTYNACIDRLRRGGPGATGAARGVRRGLAALAPADRVAVVLVDREQFTPAAAARILGLSEATIISRLEVARATLADNLPPPATPGDATAEPTEPEPTLAPAPGATEPEPTLDPAPGATEPEPALAPALGTAEPEPTLAPEPGASEPEPAPTLAPDPGATDPEPVPTLDSAPGATEPEAAVAPALGAAESEPAPTLGPAAGTAEPEPEPAPAPATGAAEQAADGSAKAAEPAAAGSAGAMEPAAATVDPSPAAGANGNGAAKGNGAVEAAGPAAPDDPDTTAELARPGESPEAGEARRRRRRAGARHAAGRTPKGGGHKPNPGSPS